MAVEENKEITRRYFEEGWNTGDLAVFDEVMVPEFKLHTTVRTSLDEGESSGTDVLDLPSFKKLVADNRLGFPDLAFAIEEMIAVGKKVVVRWTTLGTHSGLWRGLPPSGRTVSSSGIDIIHLAEGKIIEIWNSSDTFGLFHQLGALGKKSDKSEDSRKVRI